MAAQTVVGIFGSANAARDARLALIDAGISQERIVLSADLTADPIGGEAPGQSYENQPGQSPGDSAAAPFSEAVRSGGCLVSVATTTQAGVNRVEKLMREKGARIVSGYRDAESTKRAGADEGQNTTAQPSPTRSPVWDASEKTRIDFLVRRDGEEAARAWVERTLSLYREAVVASKSHAALPDYRPMFLESIKVFEDWLSARTPR